MEYNSLKTSKSERGVKIFDYDAFVYILSTFSKNYAQRSET